MIKKDHSWEAQLQQRSSNRKNGRSYEILYVEHTPAVLCKIFKKTCQFTTFLITLFCIIFLIIFFIFNYNFHGLCTN